MWTRFTEWLKGVFGLTPKPEPEVIPEYVLPEEWPFDGPKPTNEVIHILNKGLETMGEHILFRSPETGRIAGSIRIGEDEWLVKQLTFWVAEGKLKAGHTFHTMRAECGLQKCAHPEHLRPKYLASKQSPLPPQGKKTKLNINRVTGPPEYKVQSNQTQVTHEILDGDRTRCVSAKVYYDTLAQVQEVARLYNEHLRPANGRKLYGYDCDWCSGSHLTKQNPKTRPVFKHKGSWS